MAANASYNNADPAAGVVSKWHLGAAMGADVGLLEILNP